MSGFSQFLMQLVNGINAGSIYALIALGYTMVYGIAKLINFAHGDIIMVGAYVCLFAISTFQLPVWLAIVLSIVVCALLGIVVEKVAYKPLRSASRISLLITAIGVSYLLQSLFQLLFSANPRPFPTIIKLPPLVLGSIAISAPYYITFIVSVILMTVLHLFVQKTKIGKAMRAVSEDAQAAQLMGINIDRTISITFALGSALAAVAGILYCSSYPMVNPYLGSLPGIKAFIAAVLGGIGSIPGAVLGGFILGIIEALTKAYISSQLSDAIVFTVLIIMLVFKPSGILGKNVKEKV
ncbi:MAG: branched-chain amino acid ABC transporter permease [Erysipelotrichaceae bacterium]|nr:branched-chain amino acid ABC transporter permease [Erysipelotrichaceae bacterium]MDY5251528.1 branched-chain amino acid ABC transporter permease [Erysipelotrichaceae bacterium]